MAGDWGVLSTASEKPRPPTTTEMSWEVDPLVFSDRSQQLDLRDPEPDSRSSDTPDPHMSLLFEAAEFWSDLLM